MSRLLPLVLLASFLGCSQSREAGDDRAGLPSRSEGSGTAAALTQSSDTPLAASYPESPEVRKLLFRAGELEGKAEFHGALALVDEALQLDPQSPAASAMKVRLERIIRRV